MSTKGKVIHGLDNRPLSGVACFQVDVSTIRRVNWLNQGRTVVIYFRGQKVPMHVHDKSVVQAFWQAVESGANVPQAVAAALNDTCSLKYLELRTYRFRQRVAQVTSVDPEYCTYPDARLQIWITPQQCGGKSSDKSTLAYACGSLIIYRD